MKIDKEGIEEIKNLIENPVVALATLLSERGQLDHEASEIVTFTLENIQKLGNEQWKIVE
tara:strand:+ start:633 stop:812 length:180 start_codon:yes stop_codon:yes gene_type:complete